MPSEAAARQARQMWVHLKRCWASLFFSRAMALLSTRLAERESAGQPAGAAAAKGTGGSGGRSGSRPSHFGGPPKVIGCSGGAACNVCAHCGSAAAACAPTGCSGC